MDSKTGKPIDYAKKYKRKECEDLLKRKFFVAPSFEIYGGVSGLYDYGPLGCQLKSNVEALWRQHFVLEEDMLEVGCSNITPEEVLKTSGHVEKFADFMIKDSKTGQCHRADKVIIETVEKMLQKKNIKPELSERLNRIMIDAEEMQPAELDAVVKELNIKAPVTNNELEPAVPFNLMFETQIGPTGQITGYLRPETSQGIFLNFRRLIEHNNGKMPFAAAQIGLGFRNEIHPKQGLLRVREFMMAEIEHFTHPDEKDHPKFHRVKDMKLPLFSATEQEATTRNVITDMTLETAVADKVIDNETLAYFMARSYQFLTDVGIRADAIRFRQHRSNEMAHYAKDCWDAEVETSYGWIEIAGHADRSCYDLMKHAQKTKVELVAAKRLPEPKKIKFIKVTVNKKLVGGSFKKEAGKVNAEVESWSEEQQAKFAEQIEANKQIELEGGFVLTAEMIKFEHQEKTINEEKYVPSVIEPSFGIGRIVYCIFEHCFKVRAEEETRTYFDFPPVIAPVKCSILPLMNNPKLNGVVQDIKSMLLKQGIASKIDDTGTAIGRRYARTDECGIPFAITVDFDTLEDQTVTMRQLDTMKQVRMKITEVASTVHSLSMGNKTWVEVMEAYPVVEAKEAAEETKE